MGIRPVPSTSPRIKTRTAHDWRRMDPIELLAEAPIFEGLAPSDLEPLRSATRTRSFARGAYLFREGDPGSHLYMVVEGEVMIGRVGEGGGQVVFAIAGPRRGLRRAGFVRRRGRKDSRCSGPDAV